tara:strand:+ start:19164 stop:20102 length:939 start_codon:yes stop_codon:yes gene_type:complete
LTDEQYAHKPVLLNESITGLAIRPEGTYIDCTFGRGGHSSAILRQLGEKGRLLALDKDPEAMIAAKLVDDNRFQFCADSFTGLQSLIEGEGLVGNVDGILFDLGVSSPQLDDATRGFSFQHDGPLDMRMDTEHGMSVAQWLTQTDAKQLAEVLREYGEERHAKRIANAVMEAQQQQPITTTKQLSDIVSRANPSWEKHKHPATRAFQGLRIFINDELNELQTALAQSLNVLAVGGRLSVISFHSLEDRIAKQFIAKHSTRQTSGPKGLPLRDDQIPPAALKKVGKAIKAGPDELAHNPRSRSAVLRIAEKLS